MASRKIYNIGNPANNFSVRELATMMLDLALTFDEYRDTAAQVSIPAPSAAAISPQQVWQWRKELLGEPRRHTQLD